MIEFFADIFGYVLNFLYGFIQNYGLALIVFSVLLKLVLLPLSIKQQKTMKKSTKIQEEVRIIQDKYKNNPEKLNQETLELYKRENMSPFSGCLSAILQIILILAMFYLVKSPLAHMKKVEPALIENYTNELKASLSEDEKKNLVYPEITLIKEATSKLNSDEELSEEQRQDYEKLYINMEFLGLDLSSVPSKDLSDPKVFIIPALYVISSFISIRLSSNIGKKKEDGKEEKTELDAVASANKSMMWMMPIMSISIALIAPLGLALYWLVNNILMTLERLILNKFFEGKEDEKNA